MSNRNWTTRRSSNPLQNSWGQQFHTTRTQAPPRNALPRGSASRQPNKAKLASLCVPLERDSILCPGRTELHSLSGTDKAVLLPRGRAGEKVPEGRMRGPQRRMSNQPSRTATGQLRRSSNPLQNSWGQQFHTAPRLPPRVMPKKQNSPGLCVPFDRDSILCPGRTELHVRTTPRLRLASAKQRNSRGCACLLSETPFSGRDGQSYIHCPARTKPSFSPATERGRRCPKGG